MTTARKRDARMEAAGKIEEAASQEAYWHWQADQLDNDARLTALLLETEAAVAADRQAEREAWQVKQARLKQRADLWMWPPDMASTTRPADSLHVGGVESMAASAPRSASTRAVLTDDGDGADAISRPRQPSSRV